MSHVDGPRIYGLFYPLLGGIERWLHHLPRIRDMGFNWIHLNPIHYPGFSGSLYAVKDYYRLNPTITPETDPDPWGTLRSFVLAAKRQGLRVLLDLVVNHTSKDSVLVMEHPEWFVRGEDGGLVSPFAIDPADARKKTVWGDLAEMDYSSSRHREELWSYMKELTLWLLNQGVGGFRCDAAYKLPWRFWAYIMDEARLMDPHVIFVAETLGCRLEEALALCPAGFDFFLSSSKWWDFRGPWCLEQYETFRHVAPSVSFPETHDTPRLAMETGADPRHARLRYLFAAFFSAGVFMPLGFEYGFKKQLDVVKSRPEDWEEPGYDITAFIREVNVVKAGCHALNVDGPIRTLEVPGPAVVLFKGSDVGDNGALALLNPDEGVSASVKLSDLPDWIRQRPGGLCEMTPGARGETFPEVLSLDPLEMRLFEYAGERCRVRHPDPHPSKAGRPGCVSCP